MTSRSRTHQKPPSSSPFFATTGFAMVVENNRNDSTVTNKGFDFKRAIGEGTSKSKCKINDTTVRTNDERNPKAVKVLSGGSSKVNAVSVSVPSSMLHKTEETVGGVEVNAVKGKFNGDVLYRLYFKGLVSDEIVNGNVACGFGVAICDLKDNLLFETNGPLVNRGTNRQEAEIKALTRGLTECLKLGVKCIVFYCDKLPILQYVTRRWFPKQKKIALLMSDVYQILEQFSFSQPELVAGSDVMFAYKLARDAVVSQVNPRVDTRQVKVVRKEECLICYNDDGAESLFSVGKCGHRFCIRCVKQHVEVKLLHGMVPNCPRDGCKSELVIDAYGKALTPKLREMWERRVKEDAVESLADIKMWRECSKCENMIELTQGISHMICRCGFEFCHNCRGVWNKKKMTCANRCPPLNYEDLVRQIPADMALLASESEYLMRQDLADMASNYYGTDSDDDDGDKEDNYLAIGRAMMNKLGLEIPENFDPFFDLPDGTIFTPDMLCPKTRRRFYEEDDDSEEMEPDQHFSQNNGPFGNAPSADDKDEESDHLAIGRAMMKKLGLEIPENFDPFFDMPDGTLFTPDMLSPKTRAKFLEADDEMEPGQHFWHNNAPPADDDDCPYFGKYGKYATVYDSDGYEIEDYSNPFHPDYPHF